MFIEKEHTQKEFLLQKNGNFYPIASFCPGKLIVIDDGIFLYT